MQRRIFGGSLALSIFLALWLISRDAGAYGIALALLSAVVAAGLSLRSERWGGLLLALGVLNAITVLPELALRAAGFDFVSGVQFGYPTPEEFWELVPDDELFWRLPPSAQPPVNSLGFFGDEPARDKPAGAWRLVVLGDSCSQQGWPESYPDLLASALRQRGVPCELINLSLSGYSSHQGRVLAEGPVRALAPDLVLVWYGWNDHWQAYGATDARKRPSLRRERLYRRSRLLQWLRRLALARGWLPAPEPLEALRVPPADYRANLEAITAAARATGAEVALVTAPSTHPALGVPAYLVERRFAPSPEAVLERHAAYAELTRQVAADGGAQLLDLERELASATELRALFTEDGIHLTARGRAAVADRIASWLEQSELLP